MNTLQPTIVALLAALILAVAFAAWQLWQLNRDLSPLLQSSAARALASI